LVHAPIEDPARPGHRRRGGAGRAHRLCRQERHRGVRAASALRRRPALPRSPRRSVRRSRAAAQTLASPNWIRRPRRVTQRVMRSAPFAVLCVFGCASLELKKIDLSARPPSNVVVYFTVDRSPGGEPLPGLTADKFRITENNRKLSPIDTQQTLLDRRLVATNDVLVLVDMSRAMTKSKALAMLDSAIDNFVLKLSNETTVGVYAFDGGEDIVPIIPLPTAAPAGKSKPAPGETPRLIDFEQRDPSANLHGAVRVALETLTDALEKAPKPLHFGTLVLISAGPDRADRVSQAKMLKAVQRVKFDLFAIGLGLDIDKDEIKQVGRTFTVLEPELT